MLTKRQKQAVLRAMESWENDAPESVVSHSVVSHYDAITTYIPMVAKHDAIFGLELFDNKEEHILGLALFLAADGEL